MKKEVILMYSGGLDSLLSCIRLVNEGYKVYLIHFDNGSSIGTENIQIGVQRLIERYKDKVEFLGIASTAVNSMKPNIEKSGSLSGTGGMLGIQTPYLILTRPRQAIPAGQNRFIGYPAFITEILGNISGYTEVDSIHLEGINATGEELSEIETILKSGVIL